MNMNYELMCYLERLYLHMQSQNKKMNEMTQIIKQLKQEVKQLKERNKPTVIKNEYKFDLLKVERLEGTLNIGINPDGSDSSIEEFAVNQSMSVPSIEKIDPDLFPKILEQIHHYLDNQAYQILQSMERKYAYPLDETYRKFILDDIKKQIGGRIRHYLNQHKLEQMEPEQFAHIEQTIIEHVKKDIDKTMEAFIKNLPQNRNET